MLRYLYGIATQGSADAFNQATIQTALSGITNQALRVRELLVGWPSASLSQAASRVGLALTSVSMAAEASVADRGLIWRGERQCRFATSGFAWMPLVELVQFEEDAAPLIVEDAIYWQIDSDATSASNVARVRIGYEIVSINATERLSLRLDALTS